MIRFNKPYLSGKEHEYITQAVRRGRLAGNAEFTKKCHQYFEDRYGFEKVFLTTSCTDALEMAAVLLRIQPGDEVILPSYAFVSTANAFVLHGAKAVFVDSTPDHPTMDVNQIEPLINDKTKAIVALHYAGFACNMDPIMNLANQYAIDVVEDAAQAIDSRYKGKPLGSIGTFGAFSFHETKNIISGEGGMLIVNDDRFTNRAEIIWEKGTNRAAFFRGEVDKYRWVDVGASYLPSDMVAAYLFAQLENLEDIQNRRIHIWNRYYEGLHELEETGYLQLPRIPDYATNNGHMFYLVCNSLQERSRLIDHLNSHNIKAVFHYLPLHRSPFYAGKHDGRSLPYAEMYGDCLLRLPLFYELRDDQIDYIVNEVKRFFV